MGVGGRWMRRQEGVKHRGTQFVQAARCAWLVSTIRDVLQGQAQNTDMLHKDMCKHMQHTHTHTHTHIPHHTHDVYVHAHTTLVHSNAHTLHTVHTHINTQVCTQASLRVYRHK